MRPPLRALLLLVLALPGVAAAVGNVSPSFTKVPPRGTQQFTAGCNGQCVWALVRDTPGARSLIR
jgi:hypothetical protein